MTSFLPAKTVSVVLPAELPIIHMMGLLRINRGFSLLETIVAMAVGSVLLVTVGQMMTSMNSGQVTMASLMNINDLIIQVTDLMRDGPVCTNTLKNLTIPSSTNSYAPTSVPNIKSGAVVPVVIPVLDASGGYPPNRPGQDGLKNVTFQLVANNPSIAPGVPMGAFIRVSYNRTYANNSSVAQSKDIPIYIVPDNPATVVKSCYGLSDSRVCTLFGASFDPASGKCGGAICMNGVCRTIFQAQQCPAGRLVTGFNAGGGITCN